MRTPSFAHLSPRTIPPGLEELVPILQQPVEVVPVRWNNDDAWEDVLGGVAVVPPESSRPLRTVDEIAEKETLTSFKNSCRLICHTNYLPSFYQLQIALDLFDID